MTKSLRGIELLGLKVKDKITGAKGVVDSICYDLYGCIQASVRPTTGPNEKGEVPPGHWYDIKRLVILNNTMVMEVPDFTVPEIGAADKPTLRG